MKAVLVWSSVVAVCIAIVVAGVVFGGEATRFLLSFLQMAPLILLAGLASLGARRDWARALTYGWMVLLISGFAVFVLLVTVMATGVLAGATGSPSRPDGAATTIANMGIALLFSIVLSIACLFRGVRALLARVVPLDPDSFVHKVALVFTVFLTAASLLNLAVLGGKPALLSIVSSVQISSNDVGQMEVGLQDNIYVLILILPMAALGAGYPFRRGLRETLVRLGLTRPSGRQVALGAGLAVALAGLMTGLDPLIAWIWSDFGWPTTDTETFNKLLGSGISPLGAVVIGVSAGVGEELSVRGLLQPRLGKLLPNLAFTSLHAYQYAPDALLTVFAVGMVLAYVRSYTSTSVAAIVHGGYDFVLVMVEAITRGGG